MADALKVGFDISQLAHHGGVATYTQNLASHLQSQKDLEMIFFYSSLRKPYRGNLKNVKKFKLPPSFFEVLFNKMRNVPIERFLGPTDVFHSSDWVQPPSKAKKITTFHDVVPLKFPQWSVPKIVEVHKRRLEIVEKEIDMVIAVSEATKKDLLEISKIPKEKITVVYEGVDSRFKKLSEKEVAEFRKKYKLPEKFVLAIGGIGERRNLDRIKEASKDYKLIITGQTIPWLSHDEFPLLYNCASVLMYPSLYEGFGLPILEAMACGTPVVTSNVSSMPEIAGGAAFLVEAEDVKDLGKNLKVAMEDKEARNDKIEKGFLQSSKFTWEKSSKQTAQIYRQLAKDFSL
jgi:glycosyltransferase involved in cell wall biosynthesis